MKSIKENDPLPIPEEYSKWIKNLIFSMLNKNPNKRPNID